MKTLALAASLALLTTGCNINCIKGSGPMEERTLVVASFTGIEVGGSTRVTIEKGAEQKITIYRYAVHHTLLIVQGASALLCDTLHTQTDPED